MQPARHLQNLQPSYIREILAAASSPGVISLAGGLPCPDNFPLALIASELQSLGQRPDLFQYGSTLGYGPLLDFLRQRYAIDQQQQLLITTGSQQGLDLIARAYLDPGDGVAMEAPSYLGALQVFHLAQAKVFSVVQNANGPDLPSLEQLFSTGKVKLFYCVPDFHNPSGISWSTEVRQQVAELCRRYQVGLIEDVPYRELRFSGDNPPLVSSFCPEQALVLRSFSKIAAPGMRIGLLNGPADWLEPIVRVKQTTDLHSSVPLQAVLLSLLQQPAFTDHLQRLTAIYQQRYQALASAIRDYLPQCHHDEVNGGMFVWLQTPQVQDSLQLAKDALQEGVAVVPGSVFYDSEAEAVPALRLNFSHAKPETLREAIRRLASVMPK